MEFQGNDLTVLLDVIGTLVGNSKLLGLPFQTTVKNHETRVVMESRAPKWRTGPQIGEQGSETYPTNCLSF